MNITSGAVKAPIDHLGLSNIARSGCKGFIARLAGSNVTLNNLLSVIFVTARLHKTQNAASLPSGNLAEVTQARLKGIATRRFGNAEEFGSLCAFLCSAQAGYVTGQNLLIDGGAYLETF